MEERNVFILGFISNTNQKFNINIPRADSSLTAGLVRQVMDDIISIGIVLTGRGQPQRADGANLITTTIERLV